MTGYSIDVVYQVFSQEMTVQYRRCSMDRASEMRRYQRWAEARGEFERFARWTPASMFYVLLRQYELSAVRRLSSASFTSQTQSV